MKFFTFVSTRSTVPFVLPLNQEDRNGLNDELVETSNMTLASPRLSEGTTAEATVIAIPVGQRAVTEVSFSTSRGCLLPYTTYRLLPHRFPFGQESKYSSLKEKTGAPVELTVELIPRTLMLVDVDEKIAAVAMFPQVIFGPTIFPIEKTNDAT